MFYLVYAKRIENTHKRTITFNYLQMRTQPGIIQRRTSEHGHTEDLHHFVEYKNTRLAVAAEYHKGKSHIYAICILLNV